MGKRWIAVLSIAMSIPSTVAGLVYGISVLVENNYISKELGYGTFFLVILGMLWLMVRYAIHKKN